MTKKKKPTKPIKEKLPCSAILEQEFQKNCMLEKSFTVLSIVSLAAIILGVLFFCFACTTSVTTITTRGTAEDVVDENQTATPNVSPTLSVPLKP